MIKIGIPREVHQGEKRVAATPQTVLRLRKLDFEVGIEKDAGSEIGFSNGSYREAGAYVFDNVRELWGWADVILKVRPPEQNSQLGIHEADLLREKGWLISFIWPAQNKRLLEHLASRKATVFAMDCVPRITRAQKMDALSAMANIAGYRAVIEAANHFPRFFGGQMTAAGRIEPAKVFVIGAGVAGLSAIGTARSLGAIVRAFDPRSATKDQVKSLGAEFLEINLKEEGEGIGGYAKEMSEAFIQAEMNLIAQQAMEVDIIISTALIPGKPAPKLITKGMVESMKPGSVIVDLAAEQGGNCVMTEPGKLITYKGVTIIGYTDLPSRMAGLSSQLYGSTLVAFLEELRSDSGLKVDYDDQVIRSALVVHEGKITYPPPVMQPALPEPGMASKNVVSVSQSAAGIAVENETKKNLNPIWLILAGMALLLIGAFVPPSKLSHFTVFILACFVGWQVIWNVKPALHTPLMSVTNAISGIIIVGGMLQISGSEINLTTILGAIAVFVATINIAGGFLVTNRMLSMFRK
ncbi:MAG: Re/Si-specific NAD(P)(+) transhydrogenase subunit alpha [Pyrinomonadaceae bacterium]|nr:Re/Si-specific NAD(P)(+) transhydrogenase subunit alpha [Pyrinomonadaceae bacterium]MCX7640187.1 Re/Si-specific NAD(P)(+) transhydrogenase subunit alpha [Pyrinomonadaceae bacterium]MDW8303225.1 Re/Si-specific NAD(P)(+) transhydrogenase subunit alpha [Acidobacteriota bacterium]